MILRLINIKRIEKTSMGWISLNHHIINKDGVRVSIETDREAFMDEEND